MRRVIDDAPYRVFATLTLLAGLTKIFVLGFSAYRRDRDGVQGLYPTWDSSLDIMSSLTREIERNSFAGASTAIGVFHPGPVYLWLLSASHNVGSLFNQAALGVWVGVSIAGVLLATLAATLLSKAAGSAFAGAGLLLVLLPNTVIGGRFGFHFGVIWNQQLALWLLLAMTCALVAYVRQVQGSLAWLIFTAGLAFQCYLETAMISGLCLLLGIVSLVVAWMRRRVSGRQLFAPCIAVVVVVAPLVARLVVEGFALPLEYLRASARPDFAGKAGTTLSEMISAATGLTLSQVCVAMVVQVAVAVYMLTKSLHRRLATAWLIGLLLSALDVYVLSQKGFESARYSWLAIPIVLPVVYGLARVAGRVNVLVPSALTVLGLSLLLGSGPYTTESFSAGLVDGPYGGLSSSPVIGRLADSVQEHLTPGQSVTVFNSAALVPDEWGISQEVFSEELDVVYSGLVLELRSRGVPVCTGEQGCQYLQGPTLRLLRPLQDGQWDVNNVDRVLISTIYGRFVVLEQGAGRS